MIKFDLQKLKNPQTADASQTMIGEKLAPLTFVDADDTDVDTPINIFNITMTERTSEI